MRKGVTAWWCADSGGAPRACGLARPGLAALAAGIVAAGVAVSGITFAQVIEVPPPPFRELGSLKGVKPPLPNLDAYVKNRKVAIVLGKALFWESRLGSDGQACASCHFQAGADLRVTNQLSPGLLAGDIKFGGLTPPSNQTASGQEADSNITVRAGDFPFHQLADEDDRKSAIIYDTNDVMSSQGTFAGAFVSITRLRKPRRNVGETCNEADPSIFHSGPSNQYAARKVEPRQTPSVINSVFNFRNFWDGRANNVFNGANPFGRRDKDAVILVKQGVTVVPKVLDLRNSSLASQADGPPLSDFEMSCAGKTFADLGRKMLKLRPLALQQVAGTDSVIGRYRHPSGFGLTGTAGKYDKLVKGAFAKNLWQGKGLFNGFKQMEVNFPFFFGVSVMLYESTLISDDSPFDKFCGANPCDPDGAGNRNALSADAQRGFEIFLDKGKCVNCHDGPEFSKAATHLQPENQEEGLVERMVMGDGGVALYDNGFYNIGVRPTAEDLGVGGVDPVVGSGRPLSFARQYLELLRNNKDPIDPFQVDPCTFEVPFNVDHDQLTFPDCSGVPTEPADLNKLRVAVDGAFKVPILRNVGLTAPYFHNGGQATLEQLVNFYNRGGDRRGEDGNDTTGSGLLGQGANGGGSNLDPDIQFLGLTPGEKLDVVALLLSLTDQRVACEKAPFDHPSLNVPNGHLDQDTNLDGRADDIILKVPAVGAAGLGVCHKNSGDLFVQ